MHVYLQSTMLPSYDFLLEHSGYNDAQRIMQSESRSTLRWAEVQPPPMDRLEEAVASLTKDPPLAKETIENTWKHCKTVSLVQFHRVYDDVSSACIACGCFVVWSPWVRGRHTSGVGGTHYEAGAFDALDCLLMSPSTDVCFLE